MTIQFNVNVLTNSVDPDRTAPRSSLIRLYAV